MPRPLTSAVCVFFRLHVSLVCRYGEALFMISKLISGVTEFLNTEAELSEVGVLQTSHVFRPLWLFLH